MVFITDIQDFGVPLFVDLDTAHADIEEEEPLYILCRDPVKTLPGQGAGS